MNASSASQPVDHIEAMFVQLAHGLTSDGQRLTLNGLSPATLFFADRPQRVVGHVNSNTFVGEWGDGENSFADDPPNAVISFMENGDTVPEDATVVLRNPKMDQDNLSYEIEILDGILPAQAGACSLFIDPIGRPLSPVSIAGARRRDRRRM